MKSKVSHSFQEETQEAKAIWFQSLTLEERMDYFVWITDLILQNNPEILKTKNAQLPQCDNFQVLKLN